MCGVLGHLAPVRQCARSVCCVSCAASWATWLLFTGVPARCVALRVRCPGPLGSCAPVCPRGLLCCFCGVLGHLAPVHRCARSVRCFACAVSWATWLLFTGVSPRCVVLRVRCLGPLGSCSPLCQLAVLCCVCGVLGHLALVHRCARSVRCFACAVCWATWLLFTGVPARFVLSRLRYPGPIGSCPPVRPVVVLLCVCGVLGHLAPVHRCARSVCCVASGLTWATWLLMTGVRAPSFALLVRCPGPLGSCSPVYPLSVLCCVCGVRGHLAPVHRCARLVRCFACAVSWATWLLFTSVPARCVVLRVRCSGPLCSCSPVCPLGVLCCVYGVLGPLAPVHRCPRSECSVGCAVSWATWLLFPGVPARCVVLRVRYPGPLGSFSLVYPLCSVSGGGWVRCRARTRADVRRLVLLATSFRAVVRCVLWALSGFAAPGGRCCLAPVRVPWLWPAACLSGVPPVPAWCAAPLPVWLLSVLWRAFPGPWCLSPPRRLAPPALLGGCAGHAEAGREQRSLCLPLPEMLTPRPLSTVPRPH